ncbi:MAG TPA: aminopeptidase [Myxococcales bacterium]|nr:aminopeptidase [Myxococcales bacterium]
MSKPAHRNAVSFDFIADLKTDFEADHKARLAQNAVTQTPADKVALNRSVVTNSPYSFSTQLDDWKVTNQKRSGRCWMFAALNLLRVDAMKTLGIKNFEFSQNYTLFWDKFERSNYFLEEILRTQDRDVDDRLVAFMLSEPLSDGGQWNMAVNIIHKHGLVPKSVMPETESSSSTGQMNKVLKYKLREGAYRLRKAASEGHAEEELQELKKETLQAIWNILCIHLGTPPDRFDWQWRDKDKNFHRKGLVTPQEFARDTMGEDLSDYVCLVHDPRPENPYQQTYTVEFLGNVAGGDPVVYLNTEISTIKRLAMEALEGGLPVWFGCDVGRQMHRGLGLWDAKLYDFENLYGTTFDLDKAGRLHHHQTLMTHAMLLTGVDVVDGSPRRWKVENSWGETGGEKGFYLMNDSWFDEYVFEIAVPRSMLAPEDQDALSTAPRVLPAWDPMGALAR